jgi:hypothetical protein
VWLVSRERSVTSAAVAAVVAAVGPTIDPVGHDRGGRDRRGGATLRCLVARQLSQRGTRRTLMTGSMEIQEDDAIHVILRNG